MEITIEKKNKKQKKSNRNTAFYLHSTTKLLTNKTLTDLENGESFCSPNCNFKCACVCERVNKFTRNLHGSIGKIALGQTDFLSWRASLKFEILPI